MRRISKKRGVLIIFFVIIFFLYIIVRTIEIRTSKPDLKEKSTFPAVSKPTPFPNQTLSIPINKQSSLQYSELGTKKLLERINNRVPLGNSDQQAKQEILKSVGGGSTIIQDAPSYKIEYMRTPDQFMVEIKKVNIDQAKNEAKAWFLSKGFTGYSLCDLPIVFYLNQDVIQQIEQSNYLVRFNPLADGC